MRKSLALAVAAATLVGCSVERPAPAASPVPEVQSISVQMNSWGKPVSDWTIQRNGQGRFSFSKGVAGGNFFDYDLVTRGFAVSAADFTKVETLLAGARRFAGGQIPCSQDLTDGVYGQIRWSDGAETRAVPFDFGCLSKTANRIYLNMWDADQLVRSLADAGETVEVKEVRQPRG